MEVLNTEIGGSLVIVDLEPGGHDGAIGLCEVNAAAQVGTSFLLPFRHGAHIHQDLPTFSEAWLFADAFIRGRPVMVYGRHYDPVQLIALLRRYEHPVPPLTTFCGLQLVRRSAPQLENKALQSVVLQWSLFTEHKISQRRAALTQGRLAQGQTHPATRANKWLLYNAQEDAWACAAIVNEVAQRLNTDLAGVLARISPFPLLGFAK